MSIDPVGLVIAFFITIIFCLGMLAYLKDQVAMLKDRVEDLEKKGDKP